MPRIRLHYRFICSPSTSWLTKKIQQWEFREWVQYTERVFGRHGIAIQTGSVRELPLPESEKVALRNAEETCFPYLHKLDTPRLHALHSRRGDVPPHEIIVYYVNKLQGTQDGCGGHIRGFPACTVAYGRDPGVTAHEVGHVLLGDFVPVHSADPLNLMHNPPPIRHEVARLTDAQAEAIKSSGCCYR